MKVKRCVEMRRRYVSYSLILFPGKPKRPVAATVCNTVQGRRVVGGTAGRIADGEKFQRERVQKVYADTKSSRGGMRTGIMEPWGEDRGGSRFFSQGRSLEVWGLVMLGQI